MRQRPWRNRRKEPDKRLDWRDPNMPVLAPVHYDGWGPKNAIEMEEVSPAERQASSQENLTNPYVNDYRHDESYWWNRKDPKNPPPLPPEPEPVQTRRVYIGGGKYREIPIEKDEK